MILECLLEKVDGYKNNPGNAFATKGGKHIPSGFSMSTISSFENIKDMHDAYSSKDGMKNNGDN